LATPLAAISAVANPTPYYAIPVDANSFSLALTVADATAGISLTLGGAPAGTNTAFANAVAPAGGIGEAIWAVVPLAGCVHVNTGSGGITWNSINVTPGLWSISAQTGAISTNGADTFTHLHASFDAGISSITTSPAQGTVTAAHITSNNANGFIFPMFKKPMFYTAVSTALNANATIDYAPNIGTGCLYGTAYAIRRR
jgi:hypothetical protein